MLLTPKVAFRFAVGATHTSTRFSASLPYRLVNSSNAALLSRNGLVASSQRSYATPGRPKKGSIEESSRKSRPRKVKAPVTKDESADSEAGEATEKKSSRPRAVKAPKEESAEAKAAREAKAAAKKAKAEQKKLKADERKAKQKQKEKERAALKKKNARQPLTDAQKAKLKKKSDVAALKELKAIALDPPLRRKMTAFTVYNGEKLKEKAANNPDKRPITALLTEAVTEYKQLSPSELEHYNHLANQSRKTEGDEYRAYIERFTPDQIRAANVARSKLRSKISGSKWKAIEDDRLLTRPVTPYTFFNMERFRSGDFKHIHITEAAKLIGQEWRGLSVADRQKYIDQAERQREQYLRDYRETYGHESNSFQGSKETTPTE